MARRTLDAMAAGGIHDQLGGGFHRYSTDAIWLVPHFEQMLYDNAQLARVYLHAWQLTGERRTSTSRPGRSTTWLRELRRATARSRPARTPTRTARKARPSSGRPTRSARSSGAEAPPLFVAAYGVTDGGQLGGPDDPVAASAPTRSWRR